MASRSSLSGLAVALTVGGGLLAYSGIAGKGFSQSLRGLITSGTNPASSPQTNPINAPSTGTTTPSSSEATLLTFGGGTPGVTGGSQTYGDFWAAVLGNLGKPVVAGNLEAMAGISKFEGFNSYFNPMNIEYHDGDASILKGIGSFNSVGVEKYAGFDQGVGATSYFLTEPHWAGVNTALTTGNFQLVNAAIKQAYTWAAYVAPSQAVCDQILASPIGQAA